MPITGMLMARAVSYTIRNAIGFIAGPDKPPVIFVNPGLRVSASIDMARNVLTRLTASAPAPAETLAICAIDVTLGESLTINGLVEIARACFTKYSNDPGSAPNAMPPQCTFGHDTFSS